MIQLFWFSLLDMDFKTDSDMYLAVKSLKFDDVRKQLLFEKSKRKACNII